jgi:hypothetical protein
MATVPATRTAALPRRPNVSRAGLVVVVVWRTTLAAPNVIAAKGFHAAAVLVKPVQLGSVDRVRSPRIVARLFIVSLSAIPELASKPVAQALLVQCRIPAAPAINVLELNVLGAIRSLARSIRIVAMTIFVTVALVQNAVNCRVAVATVTCAVPTLHLPCRVVLRETLCVPQESDREGGTTYAGVVAGNTN